jgi:hypothetical protein
MKRTYTLLLFLLATVSILAQTPEKMSYQVILRDAYNVLLTNQEVGMQISILQTTITGTAVYVETQTKTTNINGLLSLEIGTGTSSDDFSAIDWSAGPYFIKTDTDPNGGSRYIITGTSQLMSVPFAMYAKTSGNATPGPQGESGAQGTNGIPGIQGEPGATGADGTNGSNGAKGDQGIQGATGAAGTNGATGVVGANGAVGTNGTNGAKGDKGEPGANGATGAVGADGAVGTNGAKGATGEDGATGALGADGAVGTNGTNGAKGATGEDGAAGPKGPDGIPGVGIAQTLSFISNNLELSDDGGSVDLTAFIGWGLTGNIGTSGSTGTSGADGSNFIGTTDDTPFNIKVNNEKSGRITSAGDTFLGYQAGDYNGSIPLKALIPEGGLPDVSNRTAIGAYAQVTENFSSAIGSNTIVLAANATAIGYGAQVYENNTIQLGNEAVTAVQLGVETNVTLQTGFIKITGGTPAVGKVLTSDADGMAAWKAVATRVVADEFLAVANQDTFTLSQIPHENSIVRMYVNGIRISKTAYNFNHSDTTLTYNSANNGGYALTEGDRIQFDYFY